MIEYSPDRRNYSTKDLHEDDIEYVRSLMGDFQCDVQNDEDCNPVWVFVRNSRRVKDIARECNKSAIETMFLMSYVIESARGFSEHSFHRTR